MNYRERERTRACSGFFTRDLSGYLLVFFLILGGGLAEQVAAAAQVIPRFSDVPQTHWAFTYIEILAANGITSGCGGDLYCPDATTTRAQMAVFMERAIHGSSFVPPAASGSVFTDVPASYWASSWIEQLVADGVANGCTATEYCPDTDVDRAQMAVFLLRAEHGRNYTPPPASGAVFDDVPTTHWAAAWIEQLASEGITSGCDASNYCPGASLTRAQMAVFIVRTFGLVTIHALNDTGITWGGDSPSGNNTTCISNITAPQDCDQGRDATHKDDSDGHAGFSFTKLDANGDPLPDNAASWSCVKDNVTGLVWEVKTTDGGLHHKDDSYVWYNTDPATNGGFAGIADDDGAICYGYDSNDPASFCNTQAYVARVNQAGWCGHTDWRMPTKEELRSLVDYSVPYPGPTIDVGYFPNQVSSSVWSSLPYANSSAHAWALFFNLGGSSPGSKIDSHAVRLVRSGQ